MVVAKQVQKTMHQKMTEMMGDRLALLPRFGLYHRPADGKISERRRCGKSSPGSTRMGSGAT